MPTTGYSRTQYGGLLPQKVMDAEKISILASEEADFFNKINQVATPITEAGHFDFGAYPTTPYNTRGNSEYGPTARPRPRSGIVPQFNVKFFTDSARISGQLAVTSGAIGGDPLKRAIQNMTTSVSNTMNLRPFLTGSGMLGQVVSSSGATSLVVTNGRHFLNMVGSYISVKNDTSGNVNSGAESVELTDCSIDDSNGRGTLTLASPGLNDYVTVNANPNDYGVFFDDEFNQNYFGLPDVMDTGNPASGNYGGVDRSIGSNKNWRGIHLDAGIKEAEPFLFARLHTKVIIQTGSKSEDYTWHVHPYTEERLIRTALTDKRYDGGMMKFPLWGERTTMKRVPVVGHRFVPETEAWLVHWPSLEWAYPEKMNPLGNWAHQIVEIGYGKHFSLVNEMFAYECLWVIAGQLVCKAPNKFGRLFNLQRYVV